MSQPASPLEPQLRTNPLPPAPDPQTAASEPPTPCEPFLVLRRAVLGALLFMMILRVRSHSLSPRSLHSRL